MKNAAESTITDLPVCILAGGLGQRLRPITETIPKPMVPVAGKPFLQHQMAHFAALGFRHFVLAVSYRWEKIRDYFGDGGAFGWRIEYSVEPSPLGTGGAALLAGRYWGEEALVANGDTFLPEDWRRMVAVHRQTANSSPLWGEGRVGVETEVSSFGQALTLPPPLPEREGGRTSATGKRQSKLKTQNSKLRTPPLATIALAWREDCTAGGRVEVQDGKVIRFAEKSGAAGGGWVNAGVYVLDRRVLAGCSAGAAFSLERDVFPRQVGRLNAYLCRHDFDDIGTVETLAAFRSKMPPEKESHAHPAT